MIRPYESGDTEAIIDVWYQASIRAHDFVPAEFWEAEVENIRNTYLPLAQTWVYESDGKVVGFISLLDDHIGGLFVHPEQQGKGVGTELIQFARELRGWLSLLVFKENARSRAFYEKCGFSAKEESLHEPTGCVQVRMELP